MTTRSKATRLQLRAQVEQIRSAVDHGDTGDGAIAALPELDPGLRDALASAGDRASLATHLIPPAPEESVTLLRRWTSGERGLYSADGPAGPSPVCTGSRTETSSAPSSLCCGRARRSPGRTRRQGVGLGEDVVLVDDVVIDARRI
ncbi:hypothetical protein ACTXME_12025 [Brachybacterium paraconglomeratum]|uniref:hypothetical protein n=1 Tax=Brachybacterium paraconglomeratum TaxID=173362 RepID=UPI003FD30FCD